MIQTSETKSKGDILEQWHPYLLVNFWSNDINEIYKDLPCFPKFVHEADESKPNRFDAISTDLGQFSRKLLKNGSFTALCVLATIKIVIEKTTESQDFVSATAEVDLKEEGDDDSLIIEAFPLVQERVSLQHFQNIYTAICQNLHMLELQQPLTQYAKNTLFDLTAKEFECAMDVALRQRWIQEKTTNRLRASQFLLNYVANAPPLTVGVLINSPSKCTESERLKQSCLPVACLELSNSQNTCEISCSLVALYELEKGECIYVSSRPRRKTCDCFKCLYEARDQKQNIGNSSEASMAVKLSHTYFLQEKFDKALSLYRKCHDFYEKENRAIAADVWHSMSAVFLTQQKFLKAQDHWKSREEYFSMHSGIALQHEKQKAYRYFRHLPKKIGQTAPSYEAVSKNKIYLTKNFVEAKVCKELIQIAEDFASAEGWTTSRHYAVPTMDLPVHKVPRLRDWFVDWLEKDLQQLLRRQFETSKRFYVHDAFLVKYAATSKNCFLPLHFDESTHSFVLALNDGFQGGGTYFHNINKVLTPTTGALCSFRGDKVLHGGNVVRDGVRYILAVFLFLDDEEVQLDECSTETKHIETATGSKRLKVGEKGFTFSFFGSNGDD